ncbi:DUF885 domain-containing protein [Spirosoma sp.]|uniref:DUF885 domain-containing protein n=1 Tax=Spirosoma sp. TaxID=1899569 RepID=UPI003B3B9F3C
MKKSIIISLLMATMIGCQSNNKEQTTTTSNADFAAVLDDYYEQRLKLFPFEATQQGDTRYNDLFPNDVSQAFLMETKTFYTSTLDKLKGFDREKLSDEDKISSDILKREMELQLEQYPFHQEQMPFNQFVGNTLLFGQLGSGEGAQPFKTVKDYDDWLKRVSAFVAWGDTAIATFRQGVASGRILPKSLVVKMIPQMTDLVVSDPTKSLFYGPIKKLPQSFSASEKERLTTAYQKAITEQIVPTYQKLGTFLKEEYLPKARTTSGIDAIPQGPELYQYLIKTWTTTNDTPEQIHQIGLKEVARIRAEMENVKAQVGFQGSLSEFFTHLKTDKKFYPYKTPKDVLNAFNIILTKIEPNLKKYFTTTPKSKFEVRQTEKFREASASAEYNPASADGSRPGIFYVPIPDATKFNVTSGMESLFLHEAIPGHHYQVSLQQENTSLPKFRRFAWYGAYGEGWALYCESLGKELGLYTDPYQYMGALGDEIHRAIRLVVDTGLHTKHMTREQAIKYMMDNEPIAEEGATAEIERYMAIPGQALSYKIGALKIRELRSKYEQQLGNKFNLAAFHDEFLKDGCMPLDVLERKMDAWAARQK